MTTQPEKIQSAKVSDFLTALNSASQKHGLIINSDGTLYEAEDIDLQFSYQIDSKSRLERR